MLLQGNNNGVVAVCFQMIAPGTLPVYYLITVEFRGESQSFKYKFCNSNGNVLKKRKVGILNLPHKTGNS